MQIKYSIDGQRVIKRPTHSKVVRERRRLKKYRYLLDKGITIEFDVHNAYKSWRNGVIKDCNACCKTIRNMDRLYENLFPEHEVYCRFGRERIIYNIYRKEQLWILEHAQ